MELTKINERYWVNGEEVEKDVYYNALEKMIDNSVEFIEGDSNEFEEEKCEKPIENEVELCENNEDELCPLVKDLLAENARLIEENEELQRLLGEYEDHPHFNIELAFTQLWDRIDKIEFMIKHLNIPVTCNCQKAPSTLNIDPSFWTGTQNNIGGESVIDEPCVLAKDPEVPKKRKHKSKNE